MLLYPDVQARARAEINEIVKHDQMPSIDDKDSLPYLSAVLLEVLRCYTPAPLGLFAVMKCRVCMTEPLA